MRQRVRQLRDAGVEAVSVCLIHSYLNPDHERRVKEIVLEEFPEAYSVSHEVLPLYREFERFSTVCLNAYVGPKVSRYVARFDESMRRRASARRPDDAVLGWHGNGRIGDAAAGEPAHVGPGGGPHRRHLGGRLAGFDNVVTLDIGGTSADIGVAAGGQLRMRHLLDTKIGDYQAMVPMVDIDTIGAGGGSIAHVDPGGVFRVGPQSAGPTRPACYGCRRHRADGHGRPAPARAPAPDRGLGGGMKLDRALAEQAMQTVATLAMPVEDAALGALQVQKYGMTQAIELNSVRRGYDPREFTLVAAGGGGPMFACDIALELDIARVLVPPYPGIVAATGLLATDLQHEFVATERHPLKTLDQSRLQARFAELGRQAVDQLEADGVPDDRRLVRRLADCRYAGQGYEVRTEVPAGDVTDSWVEELKERFHAAHESSTAIADAPIEIINIRAVAIGRVDELQPSQLEAGDGDLSRAKTLDQDVVFDVDGKAERHATPFYERELLRPATGSPVRRSSSSTTRRR